MSRGVEVATAEGVERMSEAPATMQTLDALSAGVAVAEPGSLALRFANVRFAEWFPPCEQREGGTIITRIPGINEQQLSERLARGRPYRLEVEVQSGPREIPLQVEIRRARLEAGEVVLVEVTGITRQKEAEYMLDSYSRMVERQTRAMEQERARAEKLLLNIMPQRVYEELREFGTTTPQSFPSASVLMLDFVDFTEMAIARDPGALIAELNDVFTAFDRIVENFQGERIKTIGDAYMAVAGLPDADPDHDHNLARAALRMRRFLEKRNATSAHQWRCRIGIGRGPVIGSIVGIQKYVYDIFGPAVNLASRLEQLCEPLQILVASESYEVLRDDFVMLPLGEIEIKGFGVQDVYEVVDEARKGNSSGSQTANSVRPGRESKLIEPPWR
jgi:adenylate cyclase